MFICGIRFKTCPTKKREKPVSELVFCFILTEEEEEEEQEEEEEDE